MQDEIERESVKDVITSEKEKKKASMVIKTRVNLCASEGVRGSVRGLLQHKVFTRHKCHNYVFTYINLG